MLIQKNQSRMDSYYTHHISGKEFNSKFGGSETFHKFLHEDLTHHGMTYKVGLNEDVLPFNPSGDCESGGLYFTGRSQIHKFIDYGPKFATVLIPDDAQVYYNIREDGIILKFKSDKIVITSIDDSAPHEIYRTAVHKNGSTLQYVPSTLRNREICLTAVRECGIALKHVPNVLRSDRDICLAAIRENELAFEYVSSELCTDREICLAAVRECGFALKYISCEINDYHEICLTAVQQNRDALKYVTLSEILFGCKTPTHHHYRDELIRIIKN